MGYTIYNGFEPNADEICSIFADIKEEFAYEAEEEILEECDDLIEDIGVSASEEEAEEDEEERADDSDYDPSMLWMSNSMTKMRRPIGQLMMMRRRNRVCENNENYRDNIQVKDTVYIDFAECNTSSVHFVYAFFLFVYAI